MAKGYSTLANMGQYNDNTCILKIVQEKEGDLTKDYKSTGTKVYREDTAWMMTDILKGTIEQPYGTGYGLQLNNGQIAAGKTGTTNESKDTWFCGYTRYYTMAVWVGYDTPRAMPGVYGSTYAGRIWQSAMNVLHEGLEPADWTQPATVDLKPNDEGITDYVSTTAEVRAQQALHEKEQLKIYEQAESLIDNYEKLVANTVDDILTARKYYKEAKPLVDSLDANERRTELLKRLEARKPYFDEIEESWEQVINRALQQSEEESSREQKRAESEAESERSEEEKRINKESFLSALSDLEELEYRDEDTESLITEAIMRLQYCNTYEEASMYAKDLQTAIKRARKLPLQDEYMEEDESREQTDKRRIKDLQESLEHLEETTTAAAYSGPSMSETFPESPTPVFG
jgi:penicillin-binding protein 1A